MHDWRLVHVRADRHLATAASGARAQVDVLHPAEVRAEQSVVNLRRCHRGPGVDAVDTVDAVDAVDAVAADAVYAVSVSAVAATSFLPLLLLP